jgi:hypothetical protein
MYATSVKCKVLISYKSEPLDVCLALENSGVIHAHAGPRKWFFFGHVVLTRTWLSICFRRSFATTCQEMKSSAVTVPLAHRSPFNFVAPAHLAMSSISQAHGPDTRL